MEGGGQIFRGIRPSLQFTHELDLLNHVIMTQSHFISINKKKKALIFAFINYIFSTYRKYT